MTEPIKVKIRPSMLNNLAACPCFRPSEGDSDAALEGTMLHERMETGSDEGCDEEQLEQLKKCRELQQEFLEKATEVHKELRLEIDLTDEN